MNNVSEKNLSYLEEKNPLLALQLRLRKKEPSLTFEKKLSVDPSSLDGLDVIYVYGLGGYRQLRTWLREKKERRLILMEDDLNAFGFFLQQVETEPVLLDPQVKILSLADAAEERLKTVIWPYLFRPYQFLTAPPSDEGRKKRGDAISSLFHELKMGAEMTISLYRDYGAAQIRNVLKNLGLGAPFIKGEALRGRFKGMPAIICGAGPSLNKNIEQLRALHEKGLVFAGGSALLPLSSKSIPVHFGASIDPEPPSHRFLRQNYFELPFFFQHQIAPEIFSKLQAERVCFGHSGGFPLERWIFDQLGIELPFFEAGFTVATFLTHAAASLGCSPIIFVGMDGCQEDKGIYSDGVEQPEEREKKKDPLKTVDRFGNPVATRADFLLAKSWIEQFALEHPEIRFLNATEGGLSFEGIENVLLSEVEFDKSFDTRAAVHGILESAEKISLNQKEIAVLAEKIKKSCQNALELSVAGMHSEKLYGAQDIELEEEIFYQMVLLPLWGVWRHFLQNEEVVMQMQMPEIEKKFQRNLFFKTVCKHYLEGVFL